MKESKQALLRGLISMIAFLLLAGGFMAYATGDIQQALIAVISIGGFALFCIVPFALIFVFIGRKFFKANAKEA